MVFNHTRYQELLTRSKDHNFILAEESVSPEQKRVR